ncbi:serine protease inhibitor 2.1-like isoform X2 [Cyprinodon tularosa]|uniref:serine protease inhibitor 2.1-like isoform X2 n=1 Tax=Cyprinodon tularosa TaxID=77115 RepID=UPI0018E1E8D9|nr:serine protease inhibitor 2.1-like isoform X2 [Cyprinodon tularosa]
MMRALGVLWVLLAAVCVGRSDHHIGHGVEARDNAADDSDNNLSLVTSANKDFAFRLYKKLSDHSDSQGKNIFFSPASISAALAALSVGARGETHQQLFSALGYSSSQLAQTDVDQAFRTLLANTAAHNDLTKGSAVFVDKLFKPKPEFLDVLKQSYSAEGFSVDFLNSTEAANTINQYVSDKTNGKINKLVESLDPNTVMYLLSYIYYKGKWETPFNPYDTREDDFNVEENKKVRVQMMSHRTYYGTYVDQEIHTSVLHLHLSNSYSMLLLLPDNMTMLENNISPAHVNKWMKLMKYWEWKIFVPKFSIKTSSNLNDVLKGMGITDVFGDQANLSGLAEKKNLTVSEVVHQATLDVNEVGVYAGAVTLIRYSLIIPREAPIPELKFNRPFMVIITERNAENILFIGKIINPII